MKILDKPRSDSADAQPAPDGHLQEEALQAPAEFKPLGRDPKRALMLSLLPGAGHLYIGQVTSGLVFLFSTAVSLVLVASACFGGAMLSTLESLAKGMNLPFNAEYGSQLGAISLAHPAVLTFLFLYLCFVFYVAQDAYLFATRANNPLYPPAKGIRFAPVFGGSYLVHCAALLVLLASAFLVAAKPPEEQITVIDLMLEPPPPPKEEPIPEPPKAKAAAPKPQPKQEAPRPVEKVEKPTPKPAVTPPVVPDTPVPVAAVPTPSAPPSDTSAATGTGTGEPSGSGQGQGDPSGGGGGDGDEADFGGYLAEMEKKIRKAWFPPRGNENAKIIVAFKLNSQGKVSSVRLKTSSGLMIADTAATDAIKNAGPFGNLPKGAPDKVDIVFTFDYTVFNGGRASLK